MKNELILEIGNLQVYKVNDPHTQGPHRFYWRDKRGGLNYGPFESIYKATNNYANLTKIEKYKDRLVNVDFRLKRRIND